MQLTVCQKWLKGFWNMTSSNALFFSTELSRSDKAALSY
jgi:hypothetical protein